MKNNFSFRLSYLCYYFVDKLYNLLDFFMRKHDSVKNNILRHFIGAGFNHHDHILRSGHRRMEITLFSFCQSRIYNESSVNHPYDHRCSRDSASKGISDMDKAIDEPSIPTISGEQSGSTHMTVATTCTSLKKALGKSGLIGLSMSLEFKIAFSDGLPSLFIKPPGIFPAAYIFSS